MSCYKVIYSKCGKKCGSDVFDSYENAVSNALVTADNKVYLCVLLEFNSKKGTWKKRCTIYPNE